jgi:3-oxoacyl-[acyl-carrier protein] reductase
MNGFSEQVAIVTGAASGLGLAIAKKLHAEGAQVVSIDLNEARLGPRAVSFAIDLTKEDQVANVVNQIAERFGRIDILVNSAGVTGATNIKSHEVDTQNLRFVFDVNFMASFFTSRKVTRECSRIQRRKLL